MQKPFRILVEIAPAPDNREHADAWDQLDVRERFQVSLRAARIVMPDIFRMMGMKAEVQVGIGGYSGEDNPSLAAVIPAETNGQNMAFPARFVPNDRFRPVQAVNAWTA